jgi:hypothetical protein
MMSDPVDPRGEETEEEEVHAAIARSAQRAADRMTSHRHRPSHPLPREARRLEIEERDRERNAKRVARFATMSDDDLLAEYETNVKPLFAVGVVGEAGMMLYIRANTARMAWVELDARGDRQFQRVLAINARLKAELLADSTRAIRDL